MRVIDLMHLGRERVIACYEVDGVLVDPGPGSCLGTLMQTLGERVPRALLLTHIHLDHAGVTGALVRRWPELPVFVHERGAPHLIDPSALMRSAARLWGEENMDRLWGETVPVPERNLHLLSGGEQVVDGEFEVAYTPGHAYHHVSFRRGETAFVGDVAGVRVLDGGPVLPPTVPPEVDLEAWRDSLQRVAAWEPRRLAITHFGPVEGAVGDHLREVADRLQQWAQVARSGGREGFMAAVREAVAEQAGPELVETYEQASPPELMYAGLERYWRKRDGDSGR